MKKFVYLQLASLAFLLLLVSCATRYENNIAVGRADNSPYTFRISHLWTGQNNPIYVTTTDSIIKIWTNNGTITPKSKDDLYYYIKPEKDGAVEIYTTHINKEGKIEKSSSKFKAITPPQFKVMIDSTLFRDSATIKYDVVFEENLKTIKGTQYQIGALIPEIVVFMNDSKIGEIAFHTDKKEEQELLNKGNRIIFPSILIRDIKTDLLISTPIVDYKYR